MTKHSKRPRGNTQASINEVKLITDKIATARYVAIGNRVNDTKFDFPAGALDVPMLNTKACEAVDAASVPFNVFVNSDASPTLRGYPTLRFEEHHLNLK